MGEPDEAERLALEAVALTEQTPDFSLLRGDALLDLGEVLIANGQPRAAVDPIEAAVRLYEHKGNVVSSNTARQRLAAIREPGRLID
jgi:Flp pilus assembly protein TadD